MMQDYIDRLITARGEERLSIARQMASHGSEAIAAVDRLLNSRDKRLRLAAALVLSNVDHPRAVPGLIHALEDGEATVRLQAAAGLGNHNTGQARQALLAAFPDRSPSVSLVILRSLEQNMTKDIEEALRAIDGKRLTPRVRTELDRLLARRQETARRAASKRTAATPRPKVAKQPPLASAPWLRSLPGGLCVGRVIPGLEETVITVLAWRLPSVSVNEVRDGHIHFTADKTTMPRLVQARLLASVSLRLDRSPGVDLAADEALINPLYAFAHAKGLQSLVITGDIPSVDARALGKVLGLRSARPPGYSRTLRLHVTGTHVFVEFLAPDDYPAVRHMTQTARTLAACLSALTVTGPDDCFCDPFCSTGTVVVERGLLGPWQKAMGCDVPSADLATAKDAWKILSSLGENQADTAHFTLWEDNRLSLASGSMNALATILRPTVSELLTPEHMVEIGRVLRPGARAAILTPSVAHLKDLLNGSQLTLRQTMTVGDPPMGEIAILVRE